MKLYAPNMATWWIAVILGVLGILFRLGVVKIAGLGGYSFLCVTVAFVLLAIAALVKGL